jgi:hypothetical protein
MKSFSVWAILTALLFMIANATLASIPLAKKVDKKLLIYPQPQVSQDTLEATKTAADSLKVASDSTATTEEQEDQEEETAMEFVKYSVGLSGDIKTGNVERKLLVLRLAFDSFSPTSKQKKYPLVGFYTMPRFAWGTLNDTKAEAETFIDANLTLNYRRHDLYELFFGIYERSNLRKITNRFNIGAGLGWMIVGGNALKSERVFWSVSNAIVYENTDFETKTDILVWRNSIRNKFRWEIIKDKLSISSTVFVQPALNQDNLRWNMANQLAYKISKTLSFTFNYEQLYESVVVPTAKNTDTNMTFGITWAN